MNILPTFTSLPYILESYVDIHIVSRQLEFQSQHLSFQLVLGAFFFFFRVADHSEECLDRVVKLQSGLAAEFCKLSFIRNTAFSIHLHVVCGCFQATMADLRSCKA